MKARVLFLVTLLSVLFMGRAEAQRCLPKMRSIELKAGLIGRTAMCWEPRCQATQKAATSGCTGWNICKPTMIIGVRPSLRRSSRRRAASTTTSCRTRKRWCSSMRRVSPCRVRNGELGQEDVVRRGEAEQRGCLCLWLRRHAGHGGVPRDFIALTVRSGSVSSGVAAWGCAIRSTG